MDAHHPNNSTDNVNNCTKNWYILVFLFVAFRKSCDSVNSLKNNFNPKGFRACLLNTNYSIIIMLVKPNCVGEKEEDIVNIDDYWLVCQQKIDKAIGFRGTQTTRKHLYVAVHKSHDYLISNYIYLSVYSECVCVLCNLGHVWAMCQVSTSEAVTIGRGD